MGVRESTMSRQRWVEVERSFGQLLGLSNKVASQRFTGFTYHSSYIFFRTGSIPSSKVRLDRRSL